MRERRRERAKRREPIPAPDMRIGFGGMMCGVAGGYEAEVRSGDVRATLELLHPARECVVSIHSSLQSVKDPS